MLKDPCFLFLLVRQCEECSFECSSECSSQCSLKFVMFFEMFLGVVSDSRSIDYLFCPLKVLSLLWSVVVIGSQW